MFNKSIFCVSVMAAIVVTPRIASAATAGPTNIPVSATVNAACTISTGSAIAFNSYDPIGANATVPLNATGTVTVICSKGSKTLTIGISNGVQPAGAQRQMKNSANVDLLRYDITQPPSGDAAGGVPCVFPGSVPWTTTTPGLLVLADAPSKVARTYSVCGTIPPGQDVSTGSYADIVTATLNF